MNALGWVRYYEGSILGCVEIDRKRVQPWIDEQVCAVVPAD